MFRYAAPMSEFQPLIDQLFREEIETARQLGPEGRYRQAIRICAQNIAAAEALGEAEWSRRYRLVRALADRRDYGPPFPRQ